MNTQVNFLQYKNNARKAYESEINNAKTLDCIKFLFKLRAARNTYGEKQSFADFKKEAISDVFGVTDSIRNHPQKSNIYNKLNAVAFLESRWGALPAADNLKISVNTPKAEVIDTIYNLVIDGFTTANDIYKAIAVIKKAESEKKAQEKEKIEAARGILKDSNEKSGAESAKASEELRSLLIQAKALFSQALEEDESYTIDLFADFAESCAKKAKDSIKYSDSIENLVKLAI